MKKKPKDWIAECASSLGRLKFPSYTIAMKSDKYYTRKQKHKKKYEERDY